MIELPMFLLGQKSRSNITWCGILLATLILSGVVHAHWLNRVVSTSLSFPPNAQDDEARIKAQDLFTEGRRLFVMGTSVSMTEALKKFNDSLNYWRKIGNRRAEALTLNYIGKIYDALGKSIEALEFYNQSLPILREVKDVASEGSTLNNIGLIFASLGDKRKALEFYNRALSLMIAAGDRLAEGRALVNIGLAYVNLGERQKTLNYFQRALAISRDVGDRASEAVTLNNIGLAYNSLGEKQMALEYFDQALPILKANGDARVEAVTLSNIGYVYDSLGEKQKALEYLQRALPVLRNAGDPFLESITLNNIGLVYHSIGQFDKALDYFTQSLGLRKASGDRTGEALTLGDMGMAYDALGQTQKALDCYNGSLRLSRTIEDHETEASTLRRIALIDVKRGNLQAARVKIEAALAIVEAFRINITSQELRATYFASVHQHFETYIALLMRMHTNDPSKGFDAMALKASEQARARSMLEMLTEANADIRQGIAPALLDREHELQQKLRAASEKQTRLHDEKLNVAQIAALKKEVNAHLSAYQQIEAEIRTASPRYAALTQPAPLSVREIQRQVLDQETLLLEYSLGDDKSYLWAVTPFTMKSFELPPREEIESAARVVYQLLTARNQQIKFETAQEKTLRIEKADHEYLEAASRLSRMLLGPVAAQLGTKRLLIVGDGVLDYIPFAALPVIKTPADGNYQPLMFEHEVVALPSASTLALLRRDMMGRKPAGKVLAVIADPVFDKDDVRVKPGKNVKNPVSPGAIVTPDPRLKDESLATVSLAQSTPLVQTAARIQRLPFTRLEADEILALVPGSESKRAIDFDASRETATNPELGEYRYVHFATHGILNSQNPELSGLVLSLVNRDGSDHDGFLWAHEVFNLHLPVEMVVLSGCRTGLGKEIRGEGLVGLTRGFMYAGASRVVVSLWDISDEASAELMAQFYKGLLGKKRMPPAAALRAAQIAVWRDRRWQAPYYWAAFVLQGEAN